MRKKLSLLLVALMTVVMAFAAQPNRRAILQNSFYVQFLSNWTGTDGTEAVSSIEDVIDWGENNISAITKAENVYQGGNGGILLGKEGANGKIILKLSKTFKAKYIGFRVRKYSNEENVVKVNGKEFEISGYGWYGFSLNFDELTDVSEITFETTKGRSYIEQFWVSYPEDTKKVVEIDFSKRFDADQSWYNSQIWQKTDEWSNIYFRFRNNDGIDNPAYKTQGEAIRLYANNKMITYGNGKVIKKIEFTFAEGYEATADCFETGTFADGVWTGEDYSVVLTDNTESGLIRIKKMVVTIDEPSYYVFTGGYYGSPSMNWNDEDQVYEYTGYFYKGDKFAISDISRITGFDEESEIAAFDYAHRFAIGEGSQNAKIGEAMTLGNYGAAYIVIKDAGNYKLTLTKDKQLTITKNNIAYAKWEFLKDEDGNAKFDGDGYLEKDSIVFRYDNLFDGNSSWELDNQLYISNWWINNSYSKNCKKVVFDKSFADARLTYLDNAFSGMTALDTIVGIEYLNTSEVTSMDRMFYNCQKLKALDLTKFNTENVENMFQMFYNCQTLKELDLSKFNTENVEYFDYTGPYYQLFSGCSALEKLNVSNWSNENINSLRGMFEGLTSLKTLTMKNFGTENVTNMSDMFKNCSALENLDLSSFNAENLNQTYNMFDGCAKLQKLDLSNFKPNNFNGAMSDMFNGCAALKELNVSNLNPENSWNLRQMFKGCAALEVLDLSKWTVTTDDVDAMFEGCAKLKELDLTGFNYKADNMFKGCAILETLYINDSFRDNGSGDNIFEGCVKLPNFEEGKISAFDVLEGGDYAIDKYCGIAKVYEINTTLAAGEYMTYMVNDVVKVSDASVADGVKIATITALDTEKAVATELAVAAKKTPLLIYNGGEEKLNSIKLITAYKKGEKADATKAVPNFVGIAKGESKNMGSSGKDIDYYICNGQDFVYVKQYGSTDVDGPKCWLEIDKTLEAAAAPNMEIVWGDFSLTGINNVKAADQKSAEIYDLQGRKVSNAQKGIYIQNGKKVVVK